MREERDVPIVTELARTIGFEISDYSPGSCVVECTIEEKHLNIGGVAHGGIHATLLDTAMGGTLLSLLSGEEWCATAQLDISYLDSVGPGTRLIAHAEVIRRGRNLAHLEGRIDSEDGKKIATAKGTWAIGERRQESQEGH